LASDRERKLQLRRTLATEVARRDGDAQGRSSGSATVVVAEDEPFSLSLSHEDDVAVVAVQGTVDLYTARELRDLLNEAVPQAQGRVVLDLSATTFFDSTGLAAIIAAHQRAERIGGRLVVVNVDAEIARLLAVSGLDALLSLTDDRATAVAQLRG